MEEMATQIKTSVPMLNGTQEPRCSGQPMEIVLSSGSSAASVEVTIMKGGSVHEFDLSSVSTVEMEEGQEEKEDLLQRSMADPEYDKEAFAHGVMVSRVEESVEVESTETGESTDSEDQSSPVFRIFDKLDLQDLSQRWMAEEDVFLRKFRENINKFGVHPD
jgi:hypothetical protein